MTVSTLVLGLLCLQSPPPADVSAEATETVAWRKKREQDLMGERGWLAVSGLPWLKEGETTIGSGEANAIRLGDGPAVWGRIVRAGTRIELHPVEGAPRSLTMLDPPFRIGRTWIQLIQRGNLIGLRLWDPENPRKLAFKGLNWYEIDAAYRVRGRLIPSAPKTTVKIANVIGQVNDYVSPGIVEFEIAGRKLRLTPVYETSAQDELFYIFKDATSGKTTYGAGRFVYSALPDAEGMVIIDFNRASAPPCAFTDFATCPLPPRQNRLDRAIAAGELSSHQDR